MRKYIQSIYDYHASNELNRTISDINWHREKYRIESHFKNLLNEHKDLIPDYFIYNSYGGYISNSSEMYGHETIGIKQSRKSTEVLEIEKSDNEIKFKHHWEYGVEFMIINSTHGNTHFFIQRPKCDDSQIEHPELLLGSSKNTAYLTAKKMDKIFKTVLFYEKMTSFQRKTGLFDRLKFSYLCFKSNVLRKGVYASLSEILYELTMLIIAALTLICAYFAIPLTQTHT